MLYKFKMNLRKYGWVRKNDRQDKHAQMRDAGKAFQADPDVLGVWVGNEKGQTGLYLLKDPVTLKCTMCERNEIA